MLVVLTEQKFSALPVKDALDGVELLPKIIMDGDVCGEADDEEEGCGDDNSCQKPYQ